MSTLLTPPPIEIAKSEIAYPDLYEVVDGQVVETPNMGVYECLVAKLLFRELDGYVVANDLGRTMIETLFTLKDLRQRRRPDLAYISFESWSKDARVPRTESWDVVPDLMVEVVSPSNTANEVLKKLRQYFKAGVRLVWVIYPEEEQFYIYRSPTQIRGLEVGQEVDGEDVVPGFRLALAKLFDPQSA